MEDEIHVAQESLDRIKGMAKKQVDEQKWKELVENDNKRQEWLNFYRASNPVFSCVSDYLRHETNEVKKLEITIIALLDRNGT